MTYRDTLSRELCALRTRRVNLRRQINGLARGLITIGDAHDTSVALREAQISLRATEPRWGEVHLLLGKEPPGAPVKLLPARTRATASTSYMTKVMVPGR